MLLQVQTGATATVSTFATVVGQPNTPRKERHRQWPIKVKNISLRDSRTMQTKVSPCSRNLIIQNLQESRSFHKEFTKIKVPKILIPEKWGNLLTRKFAYYLMFCEHQIVWITQKLLGIVYFIPHVI